MIERFWRFINWVGSHELGVLVALLVVVLGIWGFAALADEVREGDTLHVDERLMHLLSRPAPTVEDPQARTTIGPPWLREVGRDITALGSAAVLTLVTLAVLGFLIIRREFSAMWLVLLTTVGGAILSTVLKEIFRRPRPDVWEHLDQVFTHSFPSGHSMLSAVVYLTLGTEMARLTPKRTVKVYFLGVALFLAVVVGISRVYMGVHYPTDVLAGWSAGLVWALLCWLLTRYLQREGKVSTDVTHGDPVPDAAD